MQVRVLKMERRALKAGKAEISLELTAGDLKTKRLFESTAPLNKQKRL